MAKEEKEVNEGLENINVENIDSGNFLLFLIFILLLMGNQESFNAYFQLFEKKVTNLSNILNAFQSTADSLQGVFSTSYTFE